MIIPKTPQNTGSVAQHYDELDVFYREIWGNHLHHGLWESGKETVEEAVQNLIKLVAKSAQLTPEMNVCDIGSGYGETARLLVQDCNVNVTALTLSKTQYEYANSLSVNSTNPTYLLGDWLTNTFPPEKFDAALSIESSEHMQDKLLFFKEANRVLKPHGKIVVCAWLAAPHPSKFQNDYLLEPICREGRLPSMGSAEEYKQWMAEAGFQNIRFTDLTTKVKKTWSICVQRSLKKFFSDKQFRHYVLNPSSQNSVFFKTLFRILIAYRYRIMQFGLFVADK